MRALIASTLAICLAPSAIAGVNKLIQQEYKQRFENQTVFLAVPIYGKRQRLAVRNAGIRLLPSDSALRFKVGEQVRVLGVSFGGDTIKFKVSSTDAVRQAELQFRFAVPLDDAFSARKSFESALRQALNESQNYTEIDKSKQNFIRHQFDDVVRELRASTAAEREFVLDALADSLPAYRRATAENRTLRQRNQELTLKLSTEQSKSQQLEKKVVEQTSEINQIKSINQSLKTDLKALNASSSSANTELRQLKQENRKMTAAVKRLQRGLGVKPNSAAPLSKQMETLMVAALKTKGDRDSIDKQLRDKQAELDQSQQLLQEQLKINTQLEKRNDQLRSNVKLLSSRGNQLGKRYLELQKQKNQLESFVQAVQAVQARWVGESREEGRRHRTMELRLKDTLVGTLETDYPSVLKIGEASELRVKFTAASINYVKLAGEEKKILSSLGEKLTVRSKLENQGEGISITSTEAVQNAKSKIKNQGDRVVGERATAEWSWQVRSYRVGELNLALLVSFVNKNDDAVPLLESRLDIESLNLARQLGHYLEPIPLALGTLFGFVLLGIISSIRRSAKRRRPPLPKPKSTTPDRIDL